MKNFLLVLTTSIAIFASLEALEITNFIHNRNSIHRTSLLANDSGGQGISFDEASAIVNGARDLIDNDYWELCHEYHLSRKALTQILKDSRVTGIFIAPYFDENENIMLLAGPSHLVRDICIPENSYAYVIKTYCPTACEITEIPLVDSLNHNYSDSIPRP